MTSDQAVDPESEGKTPGTTQVEMGGGPALPTVKINTSNGRLVALITYAALVATVGGATWETDTLGSRHGLSGGGLMLADLLTAAIVACGGVLAAHRWVNATEASNPHLKRGHQQADKDLDVSKVKRPKPG